MPFLLRSLLCLLALLIAARGDVEADHTYFEKHIRPLLVTHCYECHSTESGKSKGGLLLDSRQGWETGGDRGPAIHPGDPAASLLIQAISYKDSDLQMPPKQRLSNDDRDKLAQWIQDGAGDPREGTQPQAPKDEAIASADFWSFQPVKPSTPPDIDDKQWSHGPTDRFLSEQHLQQELSPAPDADQATRLRRLYLVLTGLPPTLEQMALFAEDSSPNAWERLTDRLLASPRFGEHWGRHWLDVTRFAESSGGGRSLMFQEAWRFRDYVIEATNDDLPYNTLIHEHLAGDVLFARDRSTNTPRQRERLVATGFLALGPTNYELQDKELLRMEVIDEQIDTMGRAFLGMTLGCARCHDHKFDPVSTEEYYALAGIFRSTETITPGNVSGFVKTGLPGPGNQKRLHFESKLKKRMAALGKAEKTDKARAEALKKEIEAFKKAGPPPIPQVMSVREQAKGEIADCAVRIRGSIRQLGKHVPRGFLVAATPPTVSATPTLSDSESGRLALAEWLTHPDNPLTARVAVNRLWHHVFGRGLVRTVDNFGLTGEAPSHPELLDYLANHFSKEGDWSNKRLIRELVSSHAFRLGQGAPHQDDPENRFLSSAHPRSLTAESLRDALLLASGQLDLAAGGLTIRKFSAYDNGYQFGQFRRRTVYAPAFRNARLEILNLFDAANPNMTQGRRTRTTLATQALFLMNSPFVMEQSDILAKKLKQQHSRPEHRLTAAYKHILNRPPSSDERELALGYLSDNDAWPTFLQTLFASVDFRSLR